ncbi:NAD(P)-dependent oxidoreductase [Vibrio parahaemolyticus]|uniref:dTDP-4-dehydrorhamnose reductase family protein n=1 Tax=Vibrio harveyi group TaxID=717610 RepID=UPI000414DA4C|nr:MULTISPECIES: SDR family oxidoreductase [Vibrio harveyi group]EGQ8135226.1 SDR family oxidoreductase [Vibrio parahaemolyticus]EGQ8148412.1 SDR family oxidoreductase [Vibrio parahaemolyticus]EGQ8252204.1 sugar nucleotide-binding protein [Vibrio parahaemolyticus]EGQ8264738.1 sugar nucleotide-binding protein [Vibrio parahaemolyticus]EGQ8269325.1 sugar nucleotide-binding protein [Vibrio parahaemolyticus]
MKVLVIGATGMLGYSIFSNLSEFSNLDVYGTVRSLNGLESFFLSTDKLIPSIDVKDFATLEKAVLTAKPDVVINCIGLIKQHDVSKQHVEAIEINALLPHKIAQLCNSIEARLIHFSTDCVFDGKTGNYLESDLPNATDLYGKSKCLGEVDYGKHITLRTSIIGHELKSSVSLIDWFLNQEGSVKGFSKAVFSGLPTAYVAKVLADFVLPNSSLSGLYQLSVDPIDKYSLISKVASVYNKKIKIERFEDFVMDRSLNSAKFREETGFVPPSWDELVAFMHTDYTKRYNNG